MILVPEAWIKLPDAAHEGLLLAWGGNGGIDFPVVFSTYNVSPEEVTISTPQEFTVIAEGISDVAVFADEATYQKERSTSFASESYVPCGAFAPGSDDSAAPEPIAFINGRVTEVYDDPASLGFASDDILLGMLTLGCDFDVVLHGDSTGRPIEVGNILSGRFLLQGWPSEE